MHWGKGNNQTIWGLQDSGSELTLIPGHPKCHYGHLVRVGAYGGQVNNRVLAQVYFTMGSVGPQIHLVSFPLVPECIIGIDVFNSW